jgi:RNA polymerase sigma-70 factor (ECF subfamily)
MTTTAPVPLEIEQHRSYLLRFALLQLRDASAAEDAVQETLLAALQGAERFGGRSAVRTWLVGILKHKIIDHLRKAQREPSIDELAGEASTDDMDALFRQDGHYAEQPASWGSPDGALEQRLFFEALERCMEALPPNTARAFMLREVMGLETAEICKELSISSTNCWVLLYRARTALRGCLEKSWFATERGNKGR